MDSKTYEIKGKEMIDYISRYLRTIRQRRVFPDVKPGYLKDVMPDRAPENGEKWDKIMDDFDKFVMPGLTHWQSPYMHAYFPGLNSYPSLLGDMLADATGNLGFTWASSPACTELEVHVMDWLARMLGLPDQFWHSRSTTMGGGVIQTTASESTYICMLAARTRMIEQQRERDSELKPNEINGKLVVYCSDQAHSSVEKACLIGLVRLHLLPGDDEMSLRGPMLQEAIEEDKKQGLIPFFLCATLGTTGACAFDNILELGPICEEHNMWMHLDAAYAGSAFICPEFRYLLDGVELASSLSFNPSKWLMVHFDCTALWVSDSGFFHRTFNVQPLYLRHENTGSSIDFMHWQVPLSRRFRSLKLWCVLRTFGVSGLQQHIRNGVRKAQLFEKLVRSDKRFQIPAKRILGLVVFRLVGENGLTEDLLKKLNSDGKLHVVPASLNGRYVIRFTVTSQYTTDCDIERDWRVICRAAEQMLSKRENSGAEVGRQVSETGRIRKQALLRKELRLSLMLSHVPTSPRFINGSFAALFESKEVRDDSANQLISSMSDDHGAAVSFDVSMMMGRRAGWYFPGQFASLGLDTKPSNVPLKETAEGK